MTFAALYFGIGIVVSISFTLLWQAGRITSESESANESIRIPLVAIGFVIINIFFWPVLVVEEIRLRIKGDGE